MRTAQGEAQFDIYEGKLIIDGTEFVIPVHVGDTSPTLSSVRCGWTLCSWSLTNQKEY